MIVDFKDDRFVVEDVSEFLSDMMRQIMPSGRHTKAVKGRVVWSTPATLTNAVRLYKKIRDWTPRASKHAEYLTQQAQTRLDVKKLSPEGQTVEGLSCAQHIGAKWLSMGSGVLADEMGSGKTVQACRALKLIGATDILVISPLSVMDSWREHLLEWSGIEANMVRGTDKQQRKALAAGGCLVMSWGLLRKYSRLMSFGSVSVADADKKNKELNAITFDAVIADEAHNAINPNSQRTRALWSIKSERYWALTGTPLANNAGDWWSMLRFVDSPNWTSRVRYIKRYCNKKDSYFGGYAITGFKQETKQELDSYTNHLLLARPIQEVIGREIVKKRTKRLAPLSRSHMKTYVELRETLRAELADKEVLTVANMLSVTVRLTQLASAQLRYEDDDEDGNPIMCEPSPKLDVLEQILDELGGLPLVVMSASKQLIMLALRRLDKRKVPYAVITGDTPGKDRQRIVHDFKSGKHQVTFATTGAGGEGIDLSASRHLVMLQRPWSMVKSNQAEDRVRRWSQNNNSVEIIDIVAPDTIDERITHILNRKNDDLYQLTKKEFLELL